MNLKRISGLAGLLLALAFLLHLGGGQLMARITGTQPTNADIVCFGPDGAELCADSSGNWVPTTNNDTSLGTSSLRFSDVRAFDATFSDDLTVTDDTTLSSDVSVAGLLSTGLQQVGTSLGATTGVYASTTIVPTASYLVLVSSGGNIQFTSTPNVSTATAIGGATAFPEGTRLVFTTTTTVVHTFVDEGGLTGSRLQLGAGTRAVGQYDTLELIYSAQDTFWREVGFTDN